MKLQEIAEKLELEITGDAGPLDAEVSNGYVSDLLSDVLANGEEGDLWITLQIHPNIVAIASIKGLAGIAIINDRQPEAETARKAAEKKIPILVGKMTAFELAGRLYALGLSGKRDEDEGI